MKVKKKSSNHLLSHGHVAMLTYILMLAAYENMHLNSCWRIAMENSEKYEGVKITCMNNFYESCFLTLSIHHS